MKRLPRWMEYDYLLVGAFFLRQTMKMANTQSAKADRPKTGNIQLPMPPVWGRSKPRVLMTVKGTNSGYSDCTLRITYTATMNADDNVVYGDEGNDNAVVMTWRRSNSSYYDTLVDDCHVYS